jgi:hypothetical protein
VSPAVRSAAIASAEEHAAVFDGRARRALLDLGAKDTSRVAAIGIAADVVANRREAARWREIAAVLREEGT